MWKSSTDFDLAPESEIMVQMSSDKHKWHLRGQNNFPINMIYLQASSTWSGGGFNSQKSVDRPKFPRKWILAIENIGPCDHFTTVPSSFGHLFENLSSFENLLKFGPSMQVTEDLIWHDTTSERWKNDRMNSGQPIFLQYWTKKML